MIPVMNQILQGKGLVKVVQGRVFVTGFKGPLEECWQQKVEAFASQVPTPDAPADGSLVNSLAPSVV